MNPVEQAIREVQRRWEEAPKAQIIDLDRARQERDRRRWMLKHTRPMPPTPPRAA